MVRIMISTSYLSQVFCLSSLLLLHTAKGNNRRVEDTIVSPNGDLTLMYGTKWQAKRQVSFDFVYNSMMEDQLTKAKIRWNRYFESGDIMFFESSFSHTVEDVQQLDDLIGNMTSNAVWISYPKNSQDEKSVSAITLSEAGASQSDIADYASIVEPLLNVGQDVYEVKWINTNTGTTFSTYTIGDSEGIIYDSIMSNFPLFQDFDDETRSRNLLTSGVERYNWLWGSERARVSWSVHCKHDGIGGMLCEKECSAWMNIGEAKIECKEPEIQGLCCILRFGWGLRTPTGSITITYDDKGKKFEVSITGIGSSAMGTGTKSDCCEATGSPTTSPTTSLAPSPQPSSTPTNSVPSVAPTESPSPSPGPSSVPSESPDPSPAPSTSPTIMQPSSSPSESPDPSPAPSWSLSSSFEPTFDPTYELSPEPSTVPSVSPPTAVERFCSNTCSFPTSSPNSAYSTIPSLAPSFNPTVTPSEPPSHAPSESPSQVPTCTNRSGIPFVPFTATNLALSQKAANFAKCVYKGNDCMPKAANVRDNGKGDRMAMYKEDDYCWIVWAGTDDKKDWCQNFKIAGTTIIGDCKVHTGFWRNYAGAGPFEIGDPVPKFVPHIKDFINDECNCQNLMFVGHSLGGASAMIAAKIWYEKEPTTITFGQPAVTGDDDCDQYLYKDNIWRFINTEASEGIGDDDIVYDPVTKINPFGDHKGGFMILPPGDDEGSIDPAQNNVAHFDKTFEATDHYGLIDDCQYGASSHNIGHYEKKLKAFVHPVGVNGE